MDEVGGPIRSSRPAQTGLPQDSSKNFELPPDPDRPLAGGGAGFAARVPGAPDLRTPIPQGPTEQTFAGFSVDTPAWVRLDSRTHAHPRTTFLRGEPPRGR